MTKRTFFSALLTLALIPAPASSAAPTEQKKNVQIRVVQEAPLTKAHKFELGAYYGFIGTDPFLTVTNYGAQLGFHFSESLFLNAMTWRHRSQSSAALDTLENNLGTSANTNNPLSYTGGELGFGLAFGKLNLLGKKIIYYDMYLLTGGGITATENGRYTTGTAGIGQHIFLSSSPNLAIKVDFRQALYRETIIEKHVLSELGKTLFSRWNSSSIITVGFSIGI